MKTIKTFLPLFIFSITHYVSASDAKPMIEFIRHDDHQKEKVLLRVHPTENILKNVSTLKNIVDNCNSEYNAIPVNIDCLSTQANQSLIANFFHIAEYGDTYHVDVTCKENTALLELAEKFESSEVMRNTIAKIPFKESVYNTLYTIALDSNACDSTQINLESGSAQQWFLRCIPHTSDEQKIELRRKLYPLQYQSAAFIALRNKIVDLLKKRKTDKKFELPEFNTLEELKNWQMSFLHQAYRAAKPSNALLSIEFQDIKKECNFNVIEEKNFSTKICVCIQCNDSKTFDTTKQFMFACYPCMKKKLNDKIIDLCDCYTLDNTVLQTFVKVHGGCLLGGPLLPTWLNHLPQIHLPLLELLIHYRGMRYYQGDGGWHSSVSRVNFGINTVDLHPVDIKALSMFQVKPRGDYRDTLICTIKINSEKNVTAVKSELRKLRKLGNFFIKFIAPDANSIDAYNPNNDGYRWRENSYSSIWVNNWFLRGIVGTVALYGIAQLIGACAHMYAEKNQRLYDLELDQYKAQLNQCTVTIPTRIQAVAGYLARTKDTITLDLPSEFNAPPFSEDPSTIMLPDIREAKHFADTLNQISHPTHGGGFWYWASWITGGLLGVSLIGKLIANQLLSLDFPIITACRIAVVKPYEEPRQDQQS